MVKKVIFIDIPLDVLSCQKKQALINGSSVWYFMLGL